MTIGIRRGLRQRLPGAAILISNFRSTLGNPQFFRRHRHPEIDAIDIAGTPERQAQPPDALGCIGSQSSSRIWMSKRDATPLTQLHGHSTPQAHLPRITLQVGKWFTVSRVRLFVDETDTASIIRAKRSESQIGQAQTASRKELDTLARPHIGHVTLTVDAPVSSLFKGALFWFLRDPLAARDPDDT